MRRGPFSTQLLASPPLATFSLATFSLATCVPCLAAALILAGPVLGGTSSLCAQSAFAQSVVQYNPGPGGGIFDPTRALDGPEGGGRFTGSIDVASLGVGGSLTLGFAVVITDGPGADLLVFENAFEAGDGVFSEVAFVEVSTDGVHFARFPARYSGPPAPLPAFGTAPFGSYRGLTGAQPVLAHVGANPIDPLDPVTAGGEAFDLWDLRLDAGVVAGLVDLQQIHFVRLVDVVAGVDVDSCGQLIYDVGGSSGSADIDAVAVRHALGMDFTDSPRVDLVREPSGFLTLRLYDPNGWQDLDFAQLRLSFRLAELGLPALLAVTRDVQLSDHSVHLRTVLPTTLARGSGGAFAAGIVDFAGHASADQLFLLRGN